MHRSWRPSQPPIHSVICGLLLLLLLSPCFLVTLKCLATPRPEVDARALGMGGAWITQAEGSSALFWNPSRLALLKRPELFYDFSQGALAASLPLHPLGVIGVSAIDLHGSDDLLFQSSYNPIGRFELGYNQLSLGYARALSRDILIGGTIGSSRSPEVNSQWRVNYDLGVWSRLGQTLALGVRIADIADTRIVDDQGKVLEEFPQQVGVGLGWHQSRWFQTGLDLDAARWELRLGGETGLSWIRLRMGILADLDEPRNPFRWSTGISLRYDKLGLNYAYLNSEERYHRLSMNWSFTSPTPHRYMEHELPVVFPEVEPARPQQRPMQTTGPRTNRSAPLTVVPRMQSPLPGSQPVNIVPSETLVRITPLEEPEYPLEKRNNWHRDTLVEQLASQYRVETALMLALIRAESNFEPDIVSSVGAVGLMQLMPDTGRALGLKVPHYTNIHQPIRDSRKDERFHPRKNLASGLAYLRALLDTYADNYALAVSAYNAGPGRVTEQVPSIAETEKHVARVMNYYYQYRASDLKREDAIQRLEDVLQSSVW